MHKEVLTAEKTKPLAFSKCIQLYHFCDASWHKYCAHINILTSCILTENVYHENLYILCVVYI